MPVLNPSFSEDEEIRLDSRQTNDGYEPYDEHVEPPTETTDNNLQNQVDTLQNQLSALTTMMAELLLKQETPSRSTPSRSSNPTSSSPSPSTPLTNSRFVSEELGHDYDFLGVDDFLTTPRNHTSMKLSGINALSGRDRMDLSIPDKTKVWREAIRGLHPDKFKAITDLSSGLESLVSMENIVRLDDMIQRLHKYLSSHGLLNVFYVIQFDINDKPMQVNLLSKCVLIDYHTLSMQDVEESVTYLLRYGREYHTENLKWSYDAILNSCTQDLRDILIGKMQIISDELHTGPILFMILMKQLTNVSPQASRIVINKLESLKMSSFEGESVSLVNKTIIAAHKWLDMIDKVPKDFECLVLNIYRSTSIPSFSRFLEAIKLHGMGFNRSMNHDELMAYAAKFYEESILDGSWDRSNHTSFNARFKGNSKINPIYQAPSGNESEVKDIFGVSHKYCKVCKRWTFGTKAHVSSEHVSNRSNTTNIQTPSSSIPQTPVNNDSNNNVNRLPRNPDFRRVNFSGGL
jgi:hypothetical protein